MFVDVLEWVYVCLSASQYDCICNSSPQKRSEMVRNKWRKLFWIGEIEPSRFIVYLNKLNNNGSANKT